MNRGKGDTSLAAAAVHVSKISAVTISDLFGARLLFEYLASIFPRRPASPTINPSTHGVPFRAIVVSTVQSL